MTTCQRLLLAAAGLSAAVAMLHLGIIFAGPAAYAYFGAPDLARVESAGSSVPDVVTAGLVLVFAAFAYYALAGAGWARRRPPLLRLGLASIGTLYTLRGLVFVPQLLQLASGVARGPLRYGWFSLGSLVTGLCYLAGTLPQWRALRTALDRTGG